MSKLHFLCPDFKHCTFQTPLRCTQNHSEMTELTRNTFLLFFWSLSSPAVQFIMHLYVVQWKWFLNIHLLIGYPPNPPPPWCKDDYHLYLLWAMVLLVEDNGSCDHHHLAELGFVGWCPFAKVTENSLYLYGKLTTCILNYHHHHHHRIAVVCRPRACWLISVQNSCTSVLNRRDEQNLSKRPLKLLTGLRLGWQVLTITLTLMLRR